jgi:uncharacterized protein DUF397
MDGFITRDGWRKSTRSGSTECVEVKLITDERPA